MKFGLFGYPNSGRKTLFELLVGERLQGKIRAAKTEGVVGIVPIRDRRLDRLAELYQPQKVTPATLEFFLAPEIPVNDSDGSVKESVFRSMERMDVLGLIVRAFEDDSVFHVRGSLDPVRDVQEWLDELLLRDQVFVEKRLERLQKGLKLKNSPEKEKELAIFQNVLAHLEKEKPVRTVEFTPEEEKLLRNYPLLTQKPLLVIINVGEEQINEELPVHLKQKLDDWQLEHLILSVKIEHELTELEPVEQEQFLAELGLREPALEKLTKTVYSLLGLITYFTVGKDEVRSWTVPAGSTAPRAARAIHADIEKGFIRAELMKYDDLISLGSEQNVKNAGLFQLKGKDYIVQDGDILSFRFNV